MKRSSCAFLVFVIALLGFPGNSLSWKEHSHKNHFVIDSANLLRLREKDNEYQELRDFLSYVAQGAWDEDFPADLTNGVRANNHYRHAISGEGLTYSMAGLWDKDVDTLTWALSNASLKPAEEFAGGRFWNLGYTPRDLDSGNMSWEKAINRYGYELSSKQLSFYTLGFVLHLLQDMGVPEHVHDDPHGASGYNAFEMWVLKNYFDGDKLRPAIGTLEPYACESINACFINLSKIGYSTDRFRGALPDASSTSPPESDLSRMFKIEYGESVRPPGVRGSATIERRWELKNYNGTEIVSWFHPFKWPLANETFVPNQVKGGGSGEWWPTSREMPGGENDSEGFYYLEMSGDWPGYGEPNYSYDGDALVSDTRQLYPAAYLPTPLPEVANQCRGWRKEKLDGKTHLYTVVGRTILPYILEYSAGLINHFLEIVDHPPYVESVSVNQEGTEKYSARWEDEVLKVPGKDNVEYVDRRTLHKKADHLKPGKAEIHITFSEPVAEVEVSIGSKPVAKVSYEHIKDNYESENFRYIGGLWSGSFEISDKGPENEDLEVRIKAVDLNEHYLDEGGLLDGKPGSPARRECSTNGNPAYLPSYGWFNYNDEADRNHVIEVMREPEDDCPPGEDCANLESHYGDEDCSKYSSDVVEYRFCLHRNYRCTELRGVDAFGERMYNGCLLRLHNSLVWDDPDAAESVCNMMNWKPTKDQCLQHVEEVRDRLRK